MKVLAVMVDVDAFRWLHFICVKLRDIASASPNFVELIAKLAEKTKRDMSAGLVLYTLESIGLDRPDLGVELHRNTYGSGNILLVELSGFFLAGHVRNNLEAALPSIKSKFAEANPSQKVALVRALASGVQRLGSEREKAGVFELLQKASQDDGKVKIAAVDSYFRLFALDPAECGKRLAELSTSKDTDVQYSLARNLWLHGVSDGELEWHLIENLARTENFGILSLLVQPISKLAPQRPTNVLNLFRGWFESGSYFSIHDVDFLLDKLGEAEPSVILKTVESWVGKSRRVDHHIPAMLSAVFSKEPAPLVKTLESWIQKDKVFRELSFKTFLEILSRAKIDSFILDECYGTVSKAAEASGVDIPKALRGEKDKLWQCRLLLGELLSPKKVLDHDAILRNLDNYPAIRDFIRRDWFVRMGKQENNTHDLLQMLERAMPDFGKIEETIDQISKEDNELKRAFLAERIRLLLGPAAHLSHLDGMLRHIKMDEKGNGELRDGLKNEDQFWQTVSEIEVAGALRSKGIVVELKPAVGRGQLDVMARFNSVEVLVEVINPEMWRTLRLVSGGASVPNRVSGKFVYEFEQHLKESQELRVPVLVVIDISRSEIDEESEENYFEGSLQYTFITNKDSGEIHDGYWSRADDAIAKKNPELNIVSGAIVYKTPLGDDCKIHLQGKIILNESAMNKLPQLTQKKLEDALFG